MLLANTPFKSELSPTAPLILATLMKYSCHSCVLLLATWATISSVASEVSFFRSDRGIASSAGTLPSDLGKPEALRWRVPLDSGHSTPLLKGSKIFLTTYRETDQELATVALDHQSGRVLWKRVAAVERIEPFHRATGNPAAPTPASDGERLYVFFGSYGLICYDLEGQKIWEQRLGPFQDEFGSGSSPVLVGDAVVLCRDHDMASFLLALDRRTGRTLWKVDRPEAVRSYSTPAIWSRNGREELLVAGALELAAYAPDSGEKLWWVKGLARIVIPVPVPSGDMIYMASWSPGGDVGGRVNLEPWPTALARWDKNGDGKLARAEIDSTDVLDRFFRMDLDQDKSLDQNEWERHAQVFQRAQNVVLALKPSGQGDLTDSAVVWRYRRGVPYVATPLVHNGIYWMVKDGGIVTRLDAATGRLLQEERLPGMGSYYASPVAGDGKVYFAGELGTVSVVASALEWKLLSSHHFDEKIYATPVPDSGRIFVRTEKALYCFGNER
jgi:outer membrane protein assembly factor BamB